MSGPADAQIAVEAFRKRLDSLEAFQVNAMVESYKPVAQAIGSEVDALTSIAQSRNLKPYQVQQLARYKSLQAQIIGEINGFAQIAGTQITQGQAAAVALSEQAAFTTMAASLPPGVTPDMLARVGLEWNRLPTEAFANFVGIAGDGAPVGALLSELGPTTATAVRSGILEGIGLGYSPRKTARMVQKATGMGLTRAMAIARTETNRSHREASRLQYANNSAVVKGYKRHSARDSDVCIACIALDGKVYELKEPMDAHVNCRCAMLPETLTYKDLGLDVPMPPPVESAQDWFQKQPSSVQLGMMKSTRRYDAWKSGQVGLNDMVQITDDVIWGKSAGVAPLKNIL